ncbi:hypothetical protein HDV00_001714 [Rhizophlyctis rosea]|nr:hypothetical protein HDV00_001714 [Rhizophlyctis rosea]
MNVSRPLALQTVQAGCNKIADTKKLGARINRHLQQLESEVKELSKGSARTDIALIAAVAGTDYMVYAVKKLIGNYGRLKNLVADLEGALDDPKLSEILLNKICSLCEKALNSADEVIQKIPQCKEIWNEKLKQHIHGLVNNDNLHQYLKRQTTEKLIQKVRNGLIKQYDITIKFLILAVLVSAYLAFEHSFDSWCTEAMATLEDETDIDDVKSALAGIESELQDIGARVSAELRRLSEAADEGLETRFDQAAADSMLSIANALWTQMNLLSNNFDSCKSVIMRLVERSSGPRFRIWRNTAISAVSLALLPVAPVATLVGSLLTLGATAYDAHSGIAIENCGKRSKSTLIQLISFVDVCDAHCSRLIRVYEMLREVEM